MKKIKKYHLYSYFECNGRIVSLNKMFFVYYYKFEWFLVMYVNARIKEDRANVGATSWTSVKVLSESFL